MLKTLVTHKFAPEPLVMAAFIPRMKAVAFGRAATAQALSEVPFSSSSPL
jgi:hypothetical protein